MPHCTYSQAQRQPLRVLCEWKIHILIHQPSPTKPTTTRFQLSLALASSLVCCLPPMVALLTSTCTHRAKTYTHPHTHKHTQTHTPTHTHPLTHTHTPIHHRTLSLRKVIDRPAVHLSIHPSLPNLMSKADLHSIRCYRQMDMWASLFKKTTFTVLGWLCFSIGRQQRVCIDYKLLLLSWKLPWHVGLDVGH